MDMLLKTEDAPITVEEIKAALCITSSDVDRVIYAGIIANSIYLRPAIWQRPDGTQYTTQGSPEQLDRCRLAICRWCSHQEDIFRVSPLTFTQIIRCKSFAEVGALSEGVAA